VPVLENIFHKYLISRLLKTIKNINARDLVDNKKSEIV
jgi:hypothetical protein